MIYEEKKRESFAMVLLAAMLTAVAAGVGQLIVDEIKEWRDKKKKKEEKAAKVVSKKK